MISQRLTAGPILQQYQLIQKIELARPLIKTTSAKTAGRVGILKLKIFATVNIEMFRHPKYYKELRKLRNKEARRVLGCLPTNELHKSDQAISLKARDGECERAPAPGHKQKSSNKQGSSNKPQATKSQAAGDKAQAPSSEGQASSHKHRDPL